MRAAPPPDSAAACAPGGLPRIAFAVAALSASPPKTNDNGAIPWHGSQIRCAHRSSPGSSDQSESSDEETDKSRLKVRSVQPTGGTL